MLLQGELFYCPKKQRNMDRPGGFAADFFQVRQAARGLVGGSLAVHAAAQRDTGAIAFDATIKVRCTSGRRLIRSRSNMASTLPTITLSNAATPGI